MHFSKISESQQCKTPLLKSQQDNKIDKIDEIQMEKERTETCKEIMKLNVHIYKNLFKHFKCLIWVRDSYCAFPLLHPSTIHTCGSQTRFLPLCSLILCMSFT